MAGKKVMMRNIPYFESWDLWYKMLDVAGQNEQRYIADIAFKYLASKGKKPEKNTAKAIWQTLRDGAQAEGITISALIEKAISIELGMVVAQVNNANIQPNQTMPLSAPFVDGNMVADKPKARGSIFDLNRDAHKPPVTTP